jgi:hypothetical protein
MLVLGAFALKLRFLVTDHEMDHTIGRGYKKPPNV